MQTYQTTIRMHQVDGAQRLFFAEQFVIAHDAWESWLQEVGLSITSLLASADYVLPVVHAEADYTAPMALGDAIRVDVACRDISKRSFSMHYAFSRDDGTVLGGVTMVHAVVGKTTGKAMPLPDPLRAMLDTLINQ